MTFSTYAAEKKPLIKKNITGFLEEKKKQMSDPFLQEAIKKLQTFSVKGKMQRGIFVVLTFEMFKGKATKEVYSAASAIEILHSGLLIHDDIMDNDTIRRGEKTIFAQYGINLYGQSMGICIGDYAFFAAMELLQNSAVAKLFAQEIQQVGLAQAKDVCFGQSANEPSEEEIRTVYKLKTARYSFSLPFSMGAMLVGVDAKTISKLEQFGEKLGIAFQIRDDELGIFGEEDVIGKPVDSDIKENKKTLLRFYLYQKASKKEKGFLKKTFGNKKLSAVDLEKVRSLIQQHGILDILEQEKTVLINEALSLLNALKIPKEYKSVMIDLARKQTARIQ